MFRGSLFLFSVLLAAMKINTEERPSPGDLLRHSWLGACNGFGRPDLRQTSLKIRRMKDGMSDDDLGKPLRLRFLASRILQA